MSYNKNNDDKKELSQHQQQQLGHSYSLTTSIVYEEAKLAMNQFTHTSDALYGNRSKEGTIRGLLARRRGGPP